MPHSASNKLYIFGASGSGTTTLGEHVAAREGLVHVDCDDHYWAPVDPPFSVKRAPSERVASTSEALGSGGWVLSGACNGWGGELIDQADLIVFVALPTPVRLKRLLAREQERYGDRIKEGGDMHQIHKDFLDWTRGYDTPDFQGRNLAEHEKWLGEQVKPICRIDGEQPLQQSINAVISSLRLLG